MQLNSQPPESSVEGFLGYLDIHSKWNTIQGEGPFAGEPASFIRLAGCNLKCPLCDTDYTSNRKIETIDSIVRWAESQPYELVVLTGGEPFRQELAQLIAGLYRSGKIIQIETNGTQYNKIPRGCVTVVCSPKTPMIHPEMERIVKAWKYVIRHDAVDSLDGLPTSALGMKKPPARPSNNAEIYVQPCDDKDEEINRLNTQAAVDSVMKFGYRLCLQVQKIIQMP